MHLHRQAFKIHAYLKYSAADALISTNCLVLQTVLTNAIIRRFETVLL